MPNDNARLANFCGERDSHLRQIEQRLQVEIANRGHEFDVNGFEPAVKAACAVMENLFKTAATEQITPELVHLAMQDATIDQILTEPVAVEEFVDPIEPIAIKTKRGTIRGRGKNQQDYLTKILTHDINFGVGPAGTGKTYLAVACAVEALQTEKVRRIILVRPAVEAGEKLGFLPGNMAQKVDPYLRPLYDALYEMLGFDRVEKLIEHNIIEIAPLAFMRGRTLNDAFIILDEAQNTTTDQMLMFLTRLGQGSRAVITGDITQQDLPKGTTSGLVEAARVLRKIDGIGIVYLTKRDVVRNPLVQRIIDAYEMDGDTGGGPRNSVESRQGNA